MFYYQVSSDSCPMNKRRGRNSSSTCPRLRAGRFSRSGTRWSSWWSPTREPGNTPHAVSGSSGKSRLCICNQHSVNLFSSSISTAQRPERLLSKLKAMNIEEMARGAARVVVIRQPKGPDGTRGFAPRGGKEKSPTVVMDLMEQLTAQ